MISRLPRLAMELSCSARDRLGHALARGGEDADATAVLHLGPDAARLALRVDQHDVRGVHEPFLLDDATRPGAAAAGLQMALLDAHLRYAHAAALAVHGQDPAGLAPIRALRHADQIPFA